MSRRNLRLSLTLATVLPSLAAAPASAQTHPDPGPFLEVFGARVELTDSDADFHTESYGLRGGYRLSNSWGVEGAVSRFNEDVDVWIGELSAKAYLIDTSHFEVYALGGPGVYKVDVDDFGEKVTLHLGIGAEIGLGRQAYLRPEVRGRWLADELKKDDGLVDYSLGVGWRF